MFVCDFYTYTHAAWDSTNTHTRRQRRLPDEPIITHYDFARPAAAADARFRVYGEIQ
jgi:hypothetical protein